MTTRPAGPLLVAAILLAACSASGGPSPSAAASPSPSPGGPFSLAELKYHLLDTLGGVLWFCDPDEYPVPRGDEPTNARERFPEIQADRVAFGAIAGRLGLDPAGDFPIERQILVYREWKILERVFLEEFAGGYRFDLLLQPPPGASEGTHFAGTITRDGALAIEQRAPSGEPPCPICLARGTAIATPGGDVPVERLRPGAAVWTTDAAGRPVVATVLAVGSARVPASHRVIRLVLADGRSVTASPRHPLPDGRRIGELRVGDLVDGALVLSADSLPYGEAATYDILPSGASGFYWADGILLASTLGR